jgi:hypothetical protein
LLLQPLIPVYAVEEADDWVLRGYTRCPAYQQRLEQWFGSAEFSQQEQASAALRERVQAVAPQLNTTLQVSGSGRAGGAGAARWGPADCRAPAADPIGLTHSSAPARAPASPLARQRPVPAPTCLQGWWNVYDAFNVNRTYGGGDPMPAVSDALFAEVRTPPMACTRSEHCAWRKGEGSLHTPSTPHPFTCRGAESTIGAAQIRQLAYWLELRKASSELSGALLGGGLLGDLLAKLGGAVEATARGSQVRSRMACGCCIHTGCCSAHSQIVYWGTCQPAC